MRGLTSGAEDYITKPFHPAEMLARVEIVMRRRKKNPPANEMSMGNLTYDILLGKVYVNGNEMTLTPKENALLRLLMENADKTMSVENIYEKVWEQPMVGYDRTARTHILNLRKKLAKSGCNHTVNNAYSKGYGLTKI
jgi:DNA-binding response OmpR family regulator